VTVTVTVTVTAVSMQLNQLKLPLFLIGGAAAIAIVGYSVSQHQRQKQPQKPDDQLDHVSTLDNKFYWLQIIDDQEQQQQQPFQQKNQNRQTNEPQKPSFRSRKTKTLLQLGTVDPSLRPRLWIILSQARKLSNDYPIHHYDTLTESFHSHSSSSTMLFDFGQQIETDLYRTFPDVEDFHQPENIAKLRRVLRAYSLHNQSIGYCQSMNFIAAILLMSGLTEADAFWVLSAIIHWLLPPAFYSDDLRGLTENLQILNRLVEQELPAVHQTLVSVHLPLDLIATPWFLCLFTVSFPFDTALRIIDWFLYEGIKVLFRVSLNILKHNEQKILLVTTFEEAFLLLKSLPETTPSKDLLKVLFLFGFFPSSTFVEPSFISKNQKAKR